MSFSGELGQKGFGLKIGDAIYNCLGRTFGISMEHVTDSKGKVIAIIDRLKRPGNIDLQRISYEETIFPDGIKLEIHNLPNEHIEVRK